MRVYDVVLVMRASVSSAAKDKLVDSVKKWMGDAKVVKVEDLGKKAFAFQMKKENEGVYVILNVQSEKGIASDFQKRLLMEEAIIRHLVVRKN